MNAPECKGCKHLNIYGSTHGGVRGLCYCGHPKALAAFKRYSNGSNREPGFIAYTVGWGQEPDIKTSPRWCPLRHPYPGWEL